jgi:hypothetical protein
MPNDPNGGVLSKLVVVVLAPVYWIANLFRGGKKQ